MIDVVVLRASEKDSSPLLSYWRQIFKLIVNLIHYLHSIFLYRFFEKWRLINILTYTFLIMDWPKNSTIITFHKIFLFSVINVRH